MATANALHLHPILQKYYQSSNANFGCRTGAKAQKFHFIEWQKKTASSFSTCKVRSSRIDKDAYEDQKENTLKRNLNFGSKSTQKDKGLNIVLRNPTPSVGLGSLRKQDPATVFVCSATGQLGSRISQKLLREGFIVRAGVSDLSFAQQLAEFAMEYQIISKDDARRLNAVEFDIQEIESIAKAIGNASKAVVTIGPAEDGPHSKVGTNDALNVIEAAKLANVKHIAVVFKSEEAPLNVLAGISSFFNSLIGKSEISFEQFINRIVEEDLNYTVLKASVGDDFTSEEYGNLVFETEGNANINDKVSMGQVALVVAEVFMNAPICENKTFEVTASSSAPSKSISELLEAIPRDGRREAFAQAQADAKAEQEARLKEQNELKAKALAQQLEAEAQKLAEKETKASQLAAQIKAGGANAPLDYFINKAREFGFEFFDGKAGVQAKPTTLIRSQPYKIKGGDSTALDAEEDKNKIEFTKPANKIEFPKPAFLNNILGNFSKEQTLLVDDDS